MRKYLTYKPKRVDHKFKKGVYVKILDSWLGEFIGVYGVIKYSDRPSTDMRTKSTIYHVELPNVKNEVPVTQRSKIPHKFVTHHFNEQELEVASQEEYEAQQVLNA